MNDAFNKYLYELALHYEPQTKVFYIPDSIKKFDLSKTKFKFSNSLGRWETTDLGSAKEFAKQASPGARKVLGRYFVETSPIDVNLIRWAEGMNPKPYQVEAAAFALQRNRSYLALDPRLGKSVASVLCYNFITHLYKMATPRRPRMLVICPSFLKENWAREIQKWSEPKVSPAEIYIVRKASDVAKLTDVFPIVIFPDSLTRFENAVTILQEFKFDLVIIDEAHRYGNATSKRTAAVYGAFTQKKGEKRKFTRGLEANGDRVISLSGTHMPNRPMELWPVLYSQCPGEIGFMSQFAYGMKYCAGYHDGFGYKFTGASNLKDLHAKIYGRYLLKMEAKDFIHMPKVYETVYLEATRTKEFDELEAWLADTNAELLVSGEVDLGETAKLRRETGRLKIGPALELIESVLEENPDEKILVFAHHIEVVEEIAKKLGASVINGKVPTDQRMKIVDDFQLNPATRTLVLNIEAGGVGLDLSSATRVIFVEFDWVPGKNRQAEDRACNVGKADAVLVQYLALAGTLDERILEAVLRKNETITKLNKGE